MTTPELGEGRRCKGYKLVPFDGQAGTPLYGCVYADMLLDTRVALGAFVRPRLAVRLALVLAGDLLPAPTPGQCHVAVGGTFLALEITDSVWAEGERSPASEVADNASAGAFVLGERLLPAPVRGSALVTLGGTPVASCDLGAFGDVDPPLAWLAARLGGVPSGTLVLLGSQAQDEPIAASPGRLDVFGPDGSVLTVELGT